MTRHAKQVIVMRKDLGMRKGKMIAQGAHASLAIFLEHASKGDDGLYTFEVTPAMSEWLGGRFTKVCVSVDSEAALDEVAAAARAAGLPCIVITDAGQTEFHGVPTKTCLAVGPAWVDDIDAVTGKLPLL